MDVVSKPVPIQYHSQYPLTDCGNAERLVDQHGDCLRFCDSMRHWFVWTGNHWSAAGGAGVQLAKKTVRAMRQERNHLMSGAEGEAQDWEVRVRRADALEKWAI